MSEHSSSGQNTITQFLHEHNLHSLKDLEEALNDRQGDPALTAQLHRIRSLFGKPSKRIKEIHQQISYREAINKKPK